MRVLVATLLGALGSSAGAQDLPIVAPDPAIAQMETHPALLLGRRAETMKALRPVARTLVIASSPAGAVEAITAWRPGLLFPVLIDDGTERASADIARFVRVFEPDEIRLLNSDADTPTAEGLARALDDAWGVGPDSTLTDAFAQAGWTPPGLVVTDEDHPSAVAALALAAGRGQPLAFVDTPVHKGDWILPDPHRDALVRQIGEAVRAQPYEWDAIGDDIDAITLCLSTQPRVKQRGTGETHALTDTTGRDAQGKRWAYAGWITGTAAESLYDATCALFLNSPGSFFIYDGYERGFAPQYATPRTAGFVEQTGLRVAHVTPPGNLPDVWRIHTRFPLDAGFVHVNSSGDPRRFQLGADGRRAYGNDVPTLKRPAIVHFIHSFSAQRQSVQNTISSRWADEGAYAYLGSVDEPLLGAFLPAEGVVGRMLAGGAFGAAVRRDELGPWRLQVVGDPLVTISKAVPPVAEAPEPIASLPTLASRTADAASGRDLAGVLRGLIMSGETDRAHSVARAALASTDADAPPVDRDAALYATVVAHAKGDAGLMIDAAKLLVATEFDDERLNARLWRTLRPSLGDGTATADTILVLTKSPRAASTLDDAKALMPAMTRLLPRSRTDAILRTLAGAAMFDGDKRAIERMLGG